MHIRSLLAGAGLTVVVAAVPLAVISVASADDGGSAESSSGAAGCWGAQARTEIRAYLDAHPDVAAEVQTIKALPADQRRDAWQAYLDANPDVAADVDQLQAQRQDAGWEIVGDASATLQQYPDLSELFDALGQAPAGERSATAHEYLDGSPQTRQELQELRAEFRADRQQCQSGS